MALGIGTRVKFLRTPDSGIVKMNLGDGMVMVHLDDVDMEIPAFEEDLIKEENYVQNNDFQQIKNEYPHLAKKEKGNLKIDTPLSKNEDLRQIKPVFSDSGIHLSFEAIKKADGEIEKLNILLLNDTASDVLYELDWIVLGEIKFSKNGKISTASFEKLGEILFDDINDAPEADISISPIYTEGVGEKQFKTLKIKTKQFLKNLHLSSFLNRELYDFILFEKLGADEKSNNDLKNYTQNIIKVKKALAQKNDDVRQYNPVADVNEYATFVNEIDLHIELLHNDPHTLSNQEIINIQLQVFENFLSKALRLGIKRVFVIHGVGKGRLKELIHARLRRHPDVKHFKNEYQERYGWGASEVLL